MNLSLLTQFHRIKVRAPHEPPSTARVYARCVTAELRVSHEEKTEDQDLWW